MAVGSVGSALGRWIQIRWDGMGWVEMRWTWDLRESEENIGTGVVCIYVFGALMESGFLVPTRYKSSVILPPEKGRDEYWDRD